MYWQLGNKMGSSQMTYFGGAASDQKADEKELERAAGDFLRRFTLLGCQRNFRVFKSAVCPTSFHTLLPLPDQHHIFIGPKSTAVIGEGRAELGHICRRRQCQWSFLMLVTAVGTDNSSCSVFGVAEAQREVSGWHVHSSLHQGADTQQGENSWSG